MAGPLEYHHLGGFVQPADTGCRGGPAGHAAHNDDFHGIHCLSSCPAPGRRLFCYGSLTDLPFFALQMSWVMVPMGQYTHQERGLNSSMVTKPSTVEVSITL